MTTERLPDPVTSQQPPDGQPTPPPITVRLDRTAEPWTPDVALWAVIKDRAEAVQFRFFKDFMDSLLLPGLRELEKERAARGDYGAIERLEDRPLKPDWAVDGATDYGILRDRVTTPPMVELLWCYWHEEGMLVQTFAAIARRFQNRRVVSGNDPLANLNIDPLRGANNLIWGWIQDEGNRLTIPRRAYEYDHQYGLSLVGRAVPNIEPADSRSKFLRAFHELLHLCVKFYEQDDDTTVVADPFPILNALKEVHMILAEGAHNQFGDLPWTARVEMMIMEWILSRPEFREFLGGRIMVPYDEEWMDRVDHVRQLYGWGDTSVMHFRDLAVYGEQILLSIRYGNWMTNATLPQGANWARAWREEIQVYIHAYRTATGVDLTADPVDQRAAESRYRQPSYYLRQQELERQRTRTRKNGPVRA